MTAFSGALAHHLHGQHGLVTDRELRRLGVSTDQRRAMVRDGVLARVVGDVYRVGSSPQSLEQRSLAVCLADDRAVVTGRAAGRLWGLRKMGAVDRVEVRLPHGAHALTAPFVQLRRCDDLPPSDITDRADGIRVVSPPRLAFDLAGCLGDDDLESVVEQILDRGWCTLPTIIGTGRRLYAPARPGSIRFGRVIGSRPAWLRPQQSDHEVRLRRSLERAGVTGLVPQHAVQVGSGWVAHPDLAVPEAQWAVEIDHVTWHGGRIDAQRDKQRDRELRLVGWQIDRVTDEEIDLRLAAVTRELVALWRQRLGHVRRAA